MRLIEIIFASTAILAVVYAAPTFKERGVVNAEEPFDSKAFVFNPRKIKHTANGRRRRGGRKHVKRTGDCGSFGLDLNTNLKFGATGEHAAPPPPPAALPAPPAPPAPPSVPEAPAKIDRDTIIVNVDNKINH
ncbi:hypothetical protein BD770DRAFT_411509 [Pilaira anomala]|nr:hypothetical protein BD770DRAFT_411509 [Pilaira anomala]